MSNIAPSAIKPTTTCYYLFEKEAIDIFSNIKLPPEKKPAFIDSCLEVLIEVNKHLFAQDNTLPLYSCRAYNEGCHLYSHRIVELKHAYNKKTEQEKSERTEENRFLHLTFFLSFALLADMNFFVRIVQETMKKMNLNKPEFPNHFKLFLRDEGKKRENASRLALNKVFEIYMKSILFSKFEVSEESIYQELKKIAQEDLRKESSGVKKLMLYTYPTFPALVFVTRKIFEDNLPFIIKVKIVTKEGMLGTVMQKFGSAKDSDPILVFEGIGTDGTYTIPYCREEAQRCPHYYRRYQALSMRHKDTETCFLCKPASQEIIDKFMPVFQDRIQKAMKSLETMFHALAVDSAEHQKEFLPFFQDFNKYPKLSTIFKEMKPLIQELGLSGQKPLAFSICHAHVNSLEKASKSALFMDTPPEELLKQTVK